MDPTKVEVIEKMPEPEDAKGSVNYLAKFVPHLSDILEPLRRLVDKDTDWCWLNINQQDFDRKKKALTSTPVLQYYDVRNPCASSAMRQTEVLEQGCCRTDSQ